MQHIRIQHALDLDILINGHIIRHSYCKYNQRYWIICMIYFLLPSGTLHSIYTMCTLQAIPGLQPECKNAKDRCIVCCLSLSIVKHLAALLSNLSIELLSHQYLCHGQQFECGCLGFRLLWYVRLLFSWGGTVQCMTDCGWAVVSVLTLRSSLGFNSICNRKMTRINKNQLQWQATIWSNEYGKQTSWTGHLVSVTPQIVRTLHGHNSDDSLLNSQQRR